MIVTGLQRTNKSPVALPYQKKNKMQAKIQIVQNSCQEEIKENNTMKIDL